MVPETEVRLGVEVEGESFVVVARGVEGGPEARGRSANERRARGKATRARTYLAS